MTPSRHDTCKISLGAGKRPEVAGAVRAGARDGTVRGLGDAGAQTGAALDRLEAALEGAGGSLQNITKLTTCIVDRGHRSAVYATIARRLKDVFPVSTGLVAAPGADGADRR